MSTTYHTLETPEIQSLQSRTLVQLDGEFCTFLEKYCDPISRIATYSFLMQSGRVMSYKGTMVLMHKNLRKVT